MWQERLPSEENLHQNITKAISQLQSNQSFSPNVLGHRPLFEEGPINASVGQAAHSPGTALLSKACHNASPSSIERHLRHLRTPTITPYLQKFLFSATPTVSYPKECSNPEQNSPKGQASLPPNRPPTHITMEAGRTRFCVHSPCTKYKARECYQVTA